MKSLQRWSSAWFIAIAFPTAALAFGTYGQYIRQNREHEQITRAALTEFEPWSLALIAGNVGTLGAVGAPDVAVSLVISNPPAHCDNGDYLKVPGYPQSREAAQVALTACRRWILGELSEAVKAARELEKPSSTALSMKCDFSKANVGGAKCTVLEHLGNAFHTSQDFYAHSNWTDGPVPKTATSPENPQGLNKRGRADWLNPRVSQPKFPIDLTDPNNPVQLISGCYEDVPESTHCNYDGGQHRVKHEFLNKDTGSISSDGSATDATTPRGTMNNNFAHAVAAAIDDTRDKLEYFKERVTQVYGKVGEHIWCAVRSDDDDYSIYKPSKCYECLRRADRLRRAIAECAAKPAPCKILWKQAYLSVKEAEELVTDYQSKHDAGDSCKR